MAVKWPTNNVVSIFADKTIVGKTTLSFETFEISQTGSLDSANLMFQIWKKIGLSNSIFQTGELKKSSADRYLHSYA